MANMANYRVTFWTSFVSIALMAPVGILGPFIAVYAENWNMRKAFLIIKTFMMIISFVIFFPSVAGTP